MNYNTYPIPAIDPSALVGMAFIPILIAIALASIIGVLTLKLAAAKGYRGYFWTGFFLQIIGLLYVIGLPLAKDNQKQSNLS